MGDRLTKERVAAIRRDVEAAVQRERGVPQAVEMAVLCGHFEALLSELDALRAAPPTTYLHADGTEEPIGELVDRLTRERDEAIAKRDATAVVLMRQAERAEAAEARVRELDRELEMERSKVRGAAIVLEKARGELDTARAQLARLREAAEAVMLRVDEDAAVTLGSALGATPGPTLAEIRRAAQVEVLREMRDRVSDQATNSGPGIAGDVLRGVAAQIHQRADDLEAGRG